LKTLSSWPKFSGRGFLGSITQNIVRKDFRQPSTASPICWTRSCNRTMVLHRQASAQEVLVSEETLSRAAARSFTWRCSATGCKDPTYYQDSNMQVFDIL
jgi:hypothetical protein